MVATPESQYGGYASEVGARHRLPCRLLQTPVPPQVVRKRRKTLREQARNEGRTVTAAQLEWDWLDDPGHQCATGNIDAFRGTHRVLGARWQIELLIKLFKQSSDLAHSAGGGHPWRILAEIFAKLIGQVIQHWLLLVFLLENTTSQPDAGGEGRTQPRHRASWAWSTTPDC